MSEIKVEKAREGAGQGTEGGEWMRARQLLKLVPISRRTLERLKNEHAVPYARVSQRCVLFRRRDIENWLAKRTIRAIG